MMSLWGIKIKYHKKSYRGQGRNKGKVPLLVLYSICEEGKNYY